MTHDLELANLRAKLRRARRASPQDVGKIIGDICKARAATLTGLRLQASVLCEILESAPGADPRAVTLARSMRQALWKGALAAPPRAGAEPK